MLRCEIELPSPWRAAEIQSLASGSYLLAQLPVAGVRAEREQVARQRELEAEALAHGHEGHGQHRRRLLQHQRHAAQRQHDLAGAAVARGRVARAALEKKLLLERPLLVLWGEGAALTYVCNRVSRLDCQNTNPDTFLAVPSRPNHRAGLGSRSNVENQSLELKSTSRNGC